MNTSGLIVALLFGFGVLFWIFTHRDVSERQAETTLRINAESAAFNAEWQRMRTGKSDSDLDKRAAEAREDASALAARNAAQAGEREVAERELAGHVRERMGLPLPTPQTDAPATQRHEVTR